MPKMRTIEQAAAYMKQKDKETALSKHAIRTLVTTGQVPSVRIGTKYLIALEALERFLVMGMNIQEDNRNVIVPIPERLQRNA